jgi:ketosteroid isomerase-like protein
MPSDEAIRIPLRLKGRLPYRRPLDERIVFLMPPLSWWFAGLAFSLPRASRARRLILAFLVRRGYAAIERGDLEFLMRVMYDPAAELSFAGKFADFDQTYHGREAAFAAYRRWVETWDDYHRQPVEVVDLGNGVLTLIRESGRGKESGAPVDAQLAMLLTFKRGRVVKHREFQSWEEGRAAVGLDG